MRYMSLILSALCVFHTATASADSTQLQQQQQRLSRLVPSTTQQRLKGSIRVAREELISRPGRGNNQRVVDSAGGGNIRGVVDSQLRHRFPTASAGAIDALAYLVIYQLWTEADQDLRQLQDALHKLNEHKRRIRNHLDTLRKRQRQLREQMRQGRGGTAAEFPVRPSTGRVAEGCPPLVVQRANSGHFHLDYPRVRALRLSDPGSLPLAVIDNELYRCGQALKQLRRLSEELGPRLQMLTEQRSKLMQTLSNLLKKVSSTADGILRNVK